MRRMRTEKIPGPYRKLLKVKVINDGGTGWVLSYRGGQKVFHGDVDEFAKFLQKIKASDNETAPRSTRNKTYKNIAQEIQTGTDRIIWVWNTNMKKIDGTVLNL